MRGRWVWTIQGTVTALVLVLAGRSVTRNWEEFRALDLALAPRPTLLLGAMVLVGVTYVLQVESWRQVLAGWGQRVAYSAAARIWFLANLGRYVPGKIWSVAGLIALAQQAGIPAGTTATSSVAIQALGLGTGAIVAAAATPGVLSPLHVIGAILAGGLTLAVLVWEPSGRLVGRLLSPKTPLRALPWDAVARAGALSLIAWVTYGLAFWALARGLVGARSLEAAPAIGIFALGYLLGWIALFAPAGVGVRELALVGLLTPALGSGAAVAVSLGSRLLLTLTEIAAALVGLALTGSAKQRAHDPS